MIYRNTLLSITLYFISFTLSAQDIWSPLESMKIKSISQTEISNDGKSIAYVVREPIMEGKKSEYLSQIWVTDIESKENIQYTFNQKSSSSPKFSPDGKKIAFLSSRSGKNQIWIMNTLGGEARMLTEMARENKIVTQMGNQGASNSGMTKVQEWFNDGKIGTVDGNI